MKTFLDSGTLTKTISLVSDFFFLKNFRLWRAPSEHLDVLRGVLVADETSQRVRQVKKVDPADSKTLFSKECTSFHVHTLGAQAMLLSFPAFFITFNISPVKETMVQGTPSTQC